MLLQKSENVHINDVSDVKMAEILFEFLTQK